MVDLISLDPSGSASLAIASFQNFSMGDVPTTTITSFVSGNTRTIFSIAAKIVDPERDNGVHWR